MLSKLTKLTICAAVINIVLSIFVIVNIATYKIASDIYEPVPPSNSINDTGTTEKPGQDTEDEDTYVPPTIRNENTVLSTSEIKELLESRNPFDIPPEIDNQNKKEQEKYNKQMEELRLKLEKELKEQADKETETLNKPQILDETGSTTDTSNDKTENTRPTDQESPTKTYITKTEATVVADNMASKYNIPVNWIIAIMESSSKFQVDLITSENNVNRKGLMQYRESDAKEIAESVGLLYQPDKDLSITTNTELGAALLSSLYKKNKDLDFVFSSYFLGEAEAEKLKGSSGNYKTEFSQTIIRMTSNN